MSILVHPTAQLENFGGSDDEEYLSVTEVSDGIVAVGWTGSESYGNGDWVGISEDGGDNAIIAKYDNNGNVIWKKSFGGSGFEPGFTVFTSVTTVSDGIVAVGYSNQLSLGSEDWSGVPSKGDTDAIIVKYDNSGNVMWMMNYGGIGSNRYESVTAISDGIVAVGHSTQSSFENDILSGDSEASVLNAIIVLYDISGNTIWKKNFGGYGWNLFYSVATVPDGFIAVGQSDQLSFEYGDWAGISGKGILDAIIVKYDNNGNVIWKKNFGGSDVDSYFSIAAVSDGIIAAGFSRQYSFGNGDWAGVSGEGDSDAIIVKYDVNGDVVWRKNFGGNDVDRFYSVTTTSDCIVAVGFSYQSSFGNGDWSGVSGKGNTDAIIVKYNNDGNIIWKKNFGGNDVDWFYSVTTASDCIVAVGFSYQSSFGNGDWSGVSGKGNTDAIIVKYELSDTGIIINAPFITTAALTPTEVGRSYSDTLTATGTMPITWSITSGSLPTGLSLSGNGTVSGIPTTAGTYNFTVSASSSWGSMTKDLMIIVNQKSDNSNNGDDPDFLLGDVNSDGELDIGDVNLLYMYVRSKAELTEDALLAADVNGDGDIDIGDVNMLYMYIRGKIASIGP